MFTPQFDKFQKDERGAATIEMVLWLPFIFFCFLMVLDASMIFANHARVSRIVQDANRTYAVGGIATCDMTEDYIEARVRVLSPGANAFCERANGVVTVWVEMPSGEIDLTGSTGVFGNVFGGMIVTASSQQMIEQGV